MVIKHLQGNIFQHLKGQIFHKISGKDAKTIVILKGDFENQANKGSVLKEDVARKYSAYFQSILHHNNGYFAQVSNKFLHF